MPETWLITACSTGFGRAIAQHLIVLGYNVAVSGTASRQCVLNFSYQVPFAKSRRSAAANLRCKRSCWFCWRPKGLLLNDHALQHILPRVGG